MSTPPENLHPIKVVVRRSGVSADLLRAWEKRYGAVTPVRTGTGRRLYTDDDIRRLRLIREAMAGGRRVGDVAAIPTQELERLVGEDQQRRGAAVSSQLPATSARFMAEALEAVQRADQPALRVVLSRALIALTPARFVTELATPFMYQVGDLWLRGTIGSGHEHAASEVMRRLMAELMSMIPPSEDAPGVLVATMSGQRHEIGALFAAATAAIAGWRVTYLGPDLPAVDIGRVARDADVAAIALSVTTAPDDIFDELAALREAVGAALPILVGGQSATMLGESAHGVTVIRSMEHFREVLQSLQEGERNRPPT